jgi:hypothetical protein
MSRSTGFVWRESRVARDSVGEGGLVPLEPMSSGAPPNPGSLPSGRGRPPCVRPLDYVRRSSGSSPWAAIAATCASRSSTKFVTTEFVTGPYDVGMESAGRTRSWDKVFSAAPRDPQPDFAPVWRRSQRPAHPRLHIRSTNPRDLAMNAGQSRPAPNGRKPSICRDVSGKPRAARSACHAEGRGFEPLQPLYPPFPLYDWRPCRSQVSAHAAPDPRSRRFRPSLSQSWSLTSAIPARRETASTARSAPYRRAGAASPGRTRSA